jgi:hypothetical protein
MVKPSLSDEFTVPLCRDHHHDLHRKGNEMVWWANLHIAPTEAARELWQTSPIHEVRQTLAPPNQPTIIDAA